MQRLLIAAVVVAAGTAGAAQAGVIESACMASDRGGNRALCGCIQSVADMTLTGSDQRKAAKLFRDPQRAQEIRQSSSNNDSVFWDRYKNFGSTAQAYCAAG